MSNWTCQDTVLVIERKRETMSTQDKGAISALGTIRTFLREGT